MNAMTDAARLPEPANAGRNQYLTFTLGSEMFALGIPAIKEIIEYSGEATVPMMPASVRGVINLRGAVVPVLDLAVRFGRSPSTITKRSCIVIVETESGGQQQVLGLLVDAVSAVLEIGAADIEPAPSFGAGLPSDFIAGMGKVNGKFVILLQLEQVLSDQQLALADDGGQAAAPAEG
jgi:purine-binding chemotaxis protein CheW